MAVGAREWIESVEISEEISARWPSYTVVLVAAEGVDPGLIADTAHSLVADADASVLVADPEAPDPHVVMWREAFREFGVAPRVARSSVDALVRRSAGGKGLPRIGAIVDLYNAVSVLHRVPIGGEDLALYTGAARLIESAGREPFETVADGQPIVQWAEAGEPVWVDDLGVTCRRWNWRQTSRTAISEATRDVGFIIDSLDGPSHDGARRAADRLAACLPGAITRVVTSR